VSREKALSAVIVKKEKVTDFIILPNAIGKTCAVQEFEEYGKRDYGRPKSDALSGMLPPKLAKIMVNLSSCDKQETILDPFCGSGTLPMEAIALGYKNIISSDISDKAVSDTKLNMDWLTSELKLTDVNYQIHNLDVRKLSKKIKPSSIDAVATEPYLGPPIKGNESEKQILKTVKELEKLYISAFEEFKLVLKPGGKIVIVIPSWHIKKVFKLDIEREIKKLGFNRKDSDDLVYKREGQKVWRNITIWEKVSKK
jgi:tRNA G10  N-methylase Trm11